MTSVDAIRSLASSTDGGTVTQVFAGLAAVIGAVSAFRLNKSNNDAAAFRRQKRELELTQEDLLATRQYAFGLRGKLADNGIASDEPPALKSTKDQ